MAPKGEGAKVHRQSFELSTWRKTSVLASAIPFPGFRFRTFVSEFSLQHCYRQSVRKLAALHAAVQLCCAAGRALVEQGVAVAAVAVQLSCELWFHFLLIFLPPFPYRLRGALFFLLQANGA